MKARARTVGLPIPGRRGRIALSSSMKPLQPEKILSRTDQMEPILHLCRLLAELPRRVGS
jgi:hypothetical protein